MRKRLILILVLGLVCTSCSKNDDISALLMGNGRITSNFTNIKSLGNKTIFTSKVIFHDGNYYHVDDCKIKKSNSEVYESNSLCYLWFFLGESGMDVAHVENKTLDFTNVKMISESLRDIDQLDTYNEFDIIRAAESDERFISDFTKVEKLNSLFSIYDQNVNITFPIYSISSKFNFPDFIIDQKYYRVVLEENFENDSKIKLMEIGIDGYQEVHDLIITKDEKVKVFGLDTGSYIIYITSVNSDCKKSNYDKIYYTSIMGEVIKEIEFGVGETILNVIDKNILYLDSLLDIYVMDSNLLHKTKVNENFIEYVNVLELKKFFDSKSNEHLNLYIYNVKERCYVYVNDTLCLVIEFVV